MHVASIYLYLFTAGESGFLLPPWKLLRRKSWAINSLLLIPFLKALAPSLLIDKLVLLHTNLMKFIKLTDKHVYWTSDPLILTIKKLEKGKRASITFLSLKFFYCSTQSRGIFFVFIFFKQSQAVSELSFVLI